MAEEKEGNGAEEEGGNESGPASSSYWLGWFGARWLRFAEFGCGLCELFFDAEPVAVGFGGDAEAEGLAVTVWALVERNVFNGFSEVMRAISTGEGNGWSRFSFFCAA